jgi:hypothetical protein
MENNSFSKYLGRRVKAVFKDQDKTKVVVGILNEVNDKYLLIDNVMVGLGDNFIFCVLQQDGAL